MGRCWGCCQENCSDCNCSCHKEDEKQYIHPLHKKYSSAELEQAAKEAKIREMKEAKAGLFLRTMELEFKRVALIKELDSIDKELSTIAADNMLLGDLNE